MHQIPDFGMNVKLSKVEMDVILSSPFMFLLGMSDIKNRFGINDYQFFRSNETVDMIN